MIPFNKPYLTGKELVYIEDAVKKGKINLFDLITVRIKNINEFI